MYVLSRRRYTQGNHRQADWGHAVSACDVCAGTRADVLTVCDNCAEANTERIRTEAKAEGAAEERAAMLALIFEFQNGPVMHVYRYAKSAMKVLEMLDRSVRARGSAPAPADTKPQTPAGQGEVTEQALAAIKTVLEGDCGHDDCQPCFQCGQRLREAIALLEKP
jgi:hypothetical protein